MHLRRLFEEMKMKGIKKEWKSMILLTKNGVFCRCIWFWRWKSLSKMKRAGYLLGALSTHRDKESLWMWTYLGCLQLPKLRHKLVTFLVHTFCHRLFCLYYICILIFFFHFSYVMYTSMIFCLQFCLLSDSHIGSIFLFTQLSFVVP